MISTARPPIDGARCALAAFGAFAALAGMAWPIVSTANIGFAAPSAQRSDTSSCVDRDPLTEALLSQRTVLPADVQLCHTATVSVTVRTTCSAVPMIIMLNMDISASMFGRPLDNAQRSAVALVDALDLDTNPETVVGIVTHGREARTLLPPTNKKSLILGRINSLSTESGDNLPAAIRVADYELSKRAGRMTQQPLQYMVIFSDGGQDARPDEAIGPARSAGSRGVQIISMCSETYYPPNCGALRDVASESRLFFDIRDASRIANHFSGETASARSVRLRSQTIVEHIPPGVAYRSASAWPAADYDPVVNSLTFTPPNPASGEYRFGYEVEPKTIGPIPFASNATRFVDTRGLVGAVQVPTTTLNVVACVPTPTPSSSPTPPPSPTPTEEGTPLPSTAIPPHPTVGRDRMPAYLPIAYFDCVSSRRQVDTVLLVDMAIDAASERSPDRRLSSAIDLAQEYVSAMAAGDRAAVYAVGSDTAHRMIGLSQDTHALRAAIERISPHPSSRLDIALDAAVAELASPRAGPDHKPIVLVLSAGRGGSVSAIREAAWRAQAAATVYSIGTGPDPDAELLIFVAGRPSRYFEATDPESIGAIHRATEEFKQCKGPVVAPPGDRPLEPHP